MKLFAQASWRIAHLATRRALPSTMPAHRLRLTRSHAVLRVRRQLEETSYPRLQMALIVALTGGAGLLASFVMLNTGLDSMALRYPLALGLAYLCFLVMLWLWLRTSARDYVDIPDLSGIGALPLPTPGGGLPGFAGGGGGDFAGGGASGSFDAPGAAQLAGAESGESLFAPLGKASSSAFDADELAIPLIVVALVLGLALASFYVVYLAPGLFAELLFDGALSLTLYRHLRHQERSHWLGTAVRKTALPFAITAVSLAAVGAGLAWYAPGARTMGEAIAQHRAR